MGNLKFRMYRILFIIMIFLMALGDAFLWLRQNWKIASALFIILVLLLIAFNKYKRTMKEKKNKAPVKLSKKFRKKYPIIIQYIPPK